VAARARSAASSPRRARLPPLRVLRRLLARLDRRRHAGGRAAPEAGRPRAGERVGGARAEDGRAARGCSGVARAAPGGSARPCQPLVPGRARRHGAGRARDRAAAAARRPEATRTLGGLGAPSRRARRRLRRPPAHLRRRPPQRPARDVRAPGAPPAGLRGRARLCAVPGVFAPVRSAAASTSTAASGADSTSTPRRRGSGSSILVPRPDRARGRARARCGRSRSRAVAAETLAVRARGAEVRTIVPDDGAARDGRRTDGRQPQRRTCSTPRSRQGRALAG
jgi:hypothetical protein